MRVATVHLYTERNSKAPKQDYKKEMEILFYLSSTCVHVLKYHSIPYEYI